MITKSPSCRYYPTASWTKYIYSTVLLCFFLILGLSLSDGGVWWTCGPLSSSWSPRAGKMTWCCAGFLVRALELENPFYLVPSSHQPWDGGPSSRVTPGMPSAHERVQNSTVTSHISLSIFPIDLHPTAHPQHWVSAPFPSLSPSSAAASSCPAPVFVREQGEPGIQPRPSCSAMQSVTTGSTSLALVCCFINTSSSHQVSRIKTSFWNMGAWQVLSRRPDILNPVSVRFSSQQRRHTLFWWCGAKWLLGQCWSLEISLSGGLMTEFFWPEGNR